MSVSQNFPNIAPSLSLDFANVKALDSRVTFARASSARYYNGVTTTKAEENLFVKSQEFNDGAWVKTDVTLVTNGAVAPDGTTTAEILVEDATSFVHRLFQGAPLISGLTYIFSVFVKDVDRQFVTIAVAGALNNYFGATFDLTGATVTSTRALGTGYSHTSSSITSVGNGWYRCVVTGVVGTTANSAIETISLSTNGNPSVGARGEQVYLGTGQSVFIWGAQLEQRSAVTAYTPTTTQPITNYIPTLLTATDNVARFDHNPTTGESLGLLIEEQRTNLLLRSEEFDTTWAANALTVVTNQVIAPDGTLSSDILYEVAATTTQNRTQNISVTNGVTYTFSVFAKKQNRDFVQLGGSGGAFGNFVFANFDLVNGVVGTTGSATTARIAPAGNGWYRCSITGVAIATTTGTVFIQSCVDGNEARGANRAGDPTKGTAVWGAQLEVGAFPTSYVATSASQVTRSADAASMTGANFSSWYNAAEGTLYGEYLAFSTKLTSGRFFTISDGTANNIVMADEFGTARVRVRKDGGTTNNMTSVLGLNGSTKTAIAIKNNDFAVSFNSATAIAGAFQTPSNLNRLEIGYERLNNNYCNTTIKKISYYPIRLTDTQIVALTS